MSNLFLIGTTFVHLHNRKTIKLEESVVMEKQRYDIDKKPLTRLEIKGWYCPKCTQTFTPEALKEATVLTPPKTPLPDYKPGGEMK